MNDETVPKAASSRIVPTVPDGATMVVTSPPSLTLESIPVRRDSYQPSTEQTTPGGPPASGGHAVIVASEATPSSILDLLRLSGSERLAIEGRLAAGGMGAIDVAVDRALDRRIAVKTLHPHLRSEELSVRMFFREARLTGLLDHPHIVPVYDLAEREDGEIFFTMKLVEGRTLQEIAAAVPRGVPDTTTLYTLLDVVAKVCDALAFAHSRGVLHNDVKPANVMVGEFGQVYLMDWGIAKLVTGGESAEEEGPAIIGTTGYMSPEQARGERTKLDQRSDVFLLGATIYELLTHRPPYLSNDRMETLLLAQSAIFPSPRKLAGEMAVPLELERIVLRAMAKSPAERYPTVSALKEDLVRFMRGGAEFPRRHFAAGETIVAEGEPAEAAYIVVEGRCSVARDTPSGRQPLDTIGAGGVFGEMAILTGGSRTATVTAEEPTTVLVVTSAVLEQELEALKPWMATLLKSLAGRFREVDTQHRATYAHAPSPARVANQLLMHVETWGEPAAGGARSVPWSTLTSELEAQLGVPPLALFSAIARYGLELDTTGDRLTIPDCGALKARLRTELTPR